MHKYQLKKNIMKLMALFGMKQRMPQMVMYTIQVFEIHLEGRLYQMNIFVLYIIPKVF